MSDEKSSERNKKRRERDTTDQMDENSDRPICTQPTVMAPSNYQVTYSANKSIYWCGDCNNHGDIVCLL